MQALGLVSAWFARVHQGSHRQAALSGVFFLLLGAVGRDHDRGRRYQPCRLADHGHDPGRDGVDDGLGFQQRQKGAGPLAGSPLRFSLRSAQRAIMLAPRAWLLLSARREWPHVSRTLLRGSTHFSHATLSGAVLLQLARILPKNRQNRQNRKKGSLPQSFGSKSISRQFDRAEGCAGGFVASSQADSGSGRFRPCPRPHTLRVLILIASCEPERVLVGW